MFSSPLSTPLKLFSLTYSDGEGFLIVYSITSRATFERVERIVERVLRVKDESSLPTSPVDAYGRPYPNHPYGQQPPSTHRVPIVIVGNKRDHFNGREVSTEEGKMLASHLGCDFYETSAKTNTNVEACFKSVVRSIKTDKKGYMPNGNGQGEGQGNQRQRKKKCLIL